MALLLLFCFLAVAFGLSDLKVSVEKAQDLSVLVTVSNPSSESLTLCVLNSPLDDATEVFRSDMFSVVHESGVKAQYIGIAEKRHLVLTDFVTLQPSQSISVNLNLQKGYWFSERGMYKVSLSTVVRARRGPISSDSLDLSSFDYLELLSDSFSVEVTLVAPAPVWPTHNITHGLGGPAPTSTCTSAESSEIKTSGTNAISAVNRGLNYLAGTTCSTTKTSYITWFGACDNTRWGNVKNKFTSVYNYLQTTYPVDCKGSQCTANTYAYVYPSDSSKTIYVCPYFWRVSSANCVMDSKPGTLIHEGSHFYGTQDYAYGITNCQNLAKSNPTNACNNADNYCFFTDSCP